MLDLFARVFGRDDASKEVAKERLRLVLVHDRASLSPQAMEDLKNDLLTVISKYMDIDDQGFKVDFSRHDDAMALVANIPIRRVKRNTL
ncbi:cell division topological specificity factor MinE [Sulfobacillus acidophilus TPY]|uniref:Cell division topological specificity factor n=1 Tax=Sulfobacillus acidophilus (strain ATCC 700253 / DSM 10332 / NAL) TaxID=679936 RepID=G8U0E3_SULAD|nr:cell division topological specificity factor MinE [Sulfobacillus acidophilus TPY]AEW06485.1 cell division topological specificity factor MinE [Sulfobacillus acidophilus DSM 10332]MCY0864325.1 cell division topological specificity factor MinE [Sulfobacillus sp.]